MTDRELRDLIQLNFRRYEIMEEYTLGKYCQSSRIHMLIGMKQCNISNLPQR